MIIEKLRNPDVFPHACGQIQVIETHISWVVLTGEYAYKIKKPVDLGFVDFTTLERRRFFCHEEVRLNRRLAPQMYLGVVSITQSGGSVQVDGSGPVVEYAVRMKQFDQQSLLTHAPPGIIDSPLIFRLAESIGQFHNTVDIAAADSRFGTPEHVLNPVLENFETLMQAAAPLQTQARQLQRDAKQQAATLQPIFHDRKATGRIRECHGDLHLGNMYFDGQQIQVFDCIEFNDDFRWIDVVSDIAFTVMDFFEKKYPQCGRRFLNAWLEVTGDYEGVRVLPFYCAYRAAVRAKVDVLRYQQNGLSIVERCRLFDESQEYLDLAHAFSQGQSAAIIITTGVSGSGKTWFSQQLIEKFDSIRVRSDVERKRMHNLPRTGPHSMPPEVLYSPASSRKTYQRLRELADLIVRAGYPVVVDATFLRADQRKLFQDLAASHRVPFCILKCEAPVNELKQRIRDRLQRASDASDADVSVLERQLTSYEPPTPAERPFVVDTSTPDWLDIVTVRAHLSHSGH